MIFFIFFKVTGKCGSVLVHLIPAPRGTGIVSAPVPKKLLQMAGIRIATQQLGAPPVPLATSVSFVN
jgi:ribosomal protein S5